MENRFGNVNIDLPVAFSAIDIYIRMDKFTCFSSNAAFIIILLYKSTCNVFHGQCKVG